MRDRPPIHPGEVLNEDFLGPLRISKYRLAKDIEVPATRIQEIVDGKRGISADTALRLSRYFGTSAEVWMVLQADYELELTRMQRGEEIEHLKPLAESA
jgi:addiction module HigA family antidote